MHFVVMTIWLTLIFLLIFLGFLQCFYPGTLRRMQDRLGRALELTSPGERVRPDRTGKPKTSIMQRAFGFLLILIGFLSLMMTFGLIR
ncbi:MAG: hypothetical protein ABSD96_14420 [Candidatus Korobacteraceae bacterium]|jgi:hypothetical protein